MLVIVGSRREGNSYNLGQKIKSACDAERIHCEIIVPGNQKIHLCTGCMDCDKNGVCDFTDDMKDNIEKIKKENLIVMITPTRWNLLSGDLKLFMDRLNSLYTTKELKDKKLIAIAIAAKKKELYSSEAALSSLISFAESAQMKVVLKEEFNECLNANDILNQEEKINNLISNIKKEALKD